jgi:hypothetical protein
MQADQPGMTKTQILLIELAVVALASVLIVLSYYAVLPFFFAGMATYSILLTGVALASVGGALAAISYRRGAGPVAWATYLGAGGDGGRSGPAPIHGDSCQLDGFLASAFHPKQTLALAI